MKPFDKKEKSESSASDDSPPQRPKRNTCQKTAGVTNGLLWREETDLKKALYASLQENKKKNWEDGDEHIDEEEQNMSSEGAIENGEEESPKKAKIHAQRKFAQGSTPNSPVLTPQKVPSVNNASTQLLPYKRPKTEDFLTFLCLRGTSILPPSLDFLNSCSRSDSSSECRSLSPDLEEYSSKDTISKNGEVREKSIKHESLVNSLSRKVGACKASSRRYVDTSTSVKKNFGHSKEVIVTKKRKIRDENEDPSKILSKSKATGLNALREKYKKQRLAADKKKLIPPKSPSSKKVPITKKPQNDNITKPPVLTQKTVPQKKTIKPLPVIQKSKITKLQKKLAFEKRKSLRSADIRPRRLAALRKKTPWIRRAKLVPPIVDVESDSSEPEIIHTTPVKKDKEQAPSIPQKNLNKPSNVSERLRSKNDQTKAKNNLTPRQMLLRKHMQSRMKAKKSVLHSKNIRSRTIVKQKAKETILRKVRKNLVLKTMSLRKDLQNKRVTRSAKHQIQEMFWSNPEKKAKAQNQKSTMSSKMEKKKSSIENQKKVLKKQKQTVETKKKETEKVIKTSKENLKRKSHSTFSNNNKSIKQSASSPKLSETSLNPAKISKRSLSRDDKPSSSGIKSLDSRVKSNTDTNASNSDSKNKPSTQNDVKKDFKNVSHDNCTTAQNKQHIASSEQISNSAVSKNSKISENVKSHVSSEPSKISSKSIEEKDRTSKLEKVKNDLDNTSNSTKLENDRNVQNNLNLLIPEKATNKDISNLMELNVNIEENMHINSDPCCSFAIQVVNEKTINRSQDTKHDSNKEINKSSETKVQKKNLDKKSLKKYSSKEENKSIKHNSEKEKLSKKDKNIKSVKKYEEKHSNKNVEEVSTTKKNSHKKESSKLKIESDIEQNEIKKIKSDHEKKNNKITEENSDVSKSSLKKESLKSKMENVEDQNELKKFKPDHEKKNVNKPEKVNRIDDLNSKSVVKSLKKDNQTESNLFRSKDVKSKNETISSNLKKDLSSNSSEIEKPADDVFVINNHSTVPISAMEKKICDNHQPCSSKEKPRNSVNSTSSSATNRETDDDSDYDLTLDQFIKLQALKASAKSDSSTKSSINENKEIKVSNKDSEKKLKKDSDSSKHKKEKESSKSKSHDKDQRTPKKEDKLSKKDPKSLAKLLKKEKSKSKKEEKSKHKKDGSSSKSKKDNDKDASKSSKNEDSLFLSNLEDFNIDHSESKKDKTKKESKLSRSSSCDETKSPKKKKKHNEFKDIEKIKNLISKSSILSEFSGFKEFKRRSSSDKSEFKKSKKKKKLALLKDKKLSKKLSAKLLRKYSKKKGLKSKKKLLKKELKEMKIAELEILTKSKKQKHKLKGEHHSKDSSDKIKNVETSLPVSSCKVTNVASTSDAAHLIAKVTESLATSNCNSSSVMDNSQACTNNTNTVSTYIIESIPDVIPPIDTLPAHISQSISASTEQYVFGSADELQGLVASDFTGVFEESFPTGTILLATRDTISQVPVHFIQDIPPPKTMADAATNTGEDDIVETVDIPENLKSDEMSVGTQTMTPIGSPSPTVELHPLVLPQAIETILKEKKGLEVSSSFTSISPIKSTPTIASTDTFPLVAQVEKSPTTMAANDSSTLTPVKSTAEECLVKSTPSGTPIKTDPSVALVKTVPCVSPSKTMPSATSVTFDTSCASPLKTSSSISPLKSLPSTVPVVTVQSLTPVVSVPCITPVKSVQPVSPDKITTSVTPTKTVPHANPIKSISSVAPVKSTPSVTPVKTANTVTPVKKDSVLNSLKTASPTVSPVKSVSSNIVNEVASTSPKVKRRSSFIKKSKTQKLLLPEGQPFPLDSAKMVSAPVYYPTAEEFRDPLEYVFKIQAEARQFGICKIVPPSSFKPECKVNDDMRFTAHNQYLHKMLKRWGPNVQHTACIKKHLKSQKVKLEQAPLIGGIELDISRFYHTVQQYGGLQQVIEKKKWQRVADALRVPKTAQDRVTKLYDAYCKYLVSYDTLPKDEKEKLEKEVLSDHERRVKLRNSHKDSDKEDDDFEDEENTDCVSKGRSMSLSNFFRIARNIMNMWFKNGPSPEEVEHEYWKVVTERQQHVVVHAGNIDSSVYQSGFACNRNSPFAKHPWNLKILTNNNNSILRFMGPVSGVTIPTLHVGMLFTTGCWYRDPHSLPWIEYLHTGASKIWYSIPAKGCDKFRQSMKKIMPEYCTNNPLWLPSDTAMVPPELLVQHGASLSRIIQNSGQFVVIFPESFTSTICCGYCVSESVYFAPTSWLDLAVKAFKDIQSSCEPPSFSLERLLLSIASDLKSPIETLQKLMPLIQNIRSKDTHLRAQLSEIGLKQWERLPIPDVKDKKKKKVDEEYEFECEVCRTHCYLSMVVTFLDETVYCLPHALEHIPKKNLKLCKLKYRYDEKDLKTLETNVSEHITAHLAKLSKKKSPKKKPSTLEK